MAKHTPLSDQLRRAIDSAPMTRYRISKDLGISEATLSRFMSGERGLTLKVVDALANYLGLRLCGHHEKEGR